MPLEGSMSDVRLPARSFGEFNAAAESWTIYAERLEQFFICYNITDETTKRAELLTSMGASTYVTLRSIIAPKKPTEKTFSELVDHLAKHFDPIPSEIAERNRFYTRFRHPDETVAAYLAELRRLSEFCNFNTHNSLDYMLRDRLVCGLNDDAIQNRLWAEDSLTLAKAITLAQSLESARRNARDLKSGVNEVIHAVSSACNSQQPRQRHKGKGSYTAQVSTSKANAHPPAVPKQKCFRCGRMSHLSSACRFLEATCFKCNIKGHIASACRKGSTREKTRTNKIADVSPDDAQVQHQEEYDVFHLHSHLPSPRRFTCEINGIQVIMELDTGSPCSLLPESLLATISNRRELRPFQISLSSFSGHKLQILGQVDVTVKYATRTAVLPLVVYKGTGPTLCGRTWLDSSLGIPIDNVNQVTGQQLSLTTVLEKHKELFSDGTGCLRNVKVHLHTKPGINPKFYKARSVPYALKEKVEQEIARLEHAGIIERLPFSQFATPIVPVMKPNGTIRICGDYKITANLLIDTEQYPLPRVDDIFANLSGCTVFSRLDMKEAYNQLELDDESKKILVINTTKGLFAYNRLPFGISSASAIFQKHMEILLQNHPGTSPFQDDILIGGKNINEHLERLDRILATFKKAGLKLRKDKCQFLQSSIDFLGHHLDANGLHPQEPKITAIMDAPSPTSVEELRSFLGLFNYYAKFIPNNATLLAPLYDLLKKSVHWQWTKHHQQTLDKAKQTLQMSKFLTHYDPRKEILLACDASPIGIGAVISHVINGEEKPISFASRTLSQTERKYAQIEKEALALVYGVSKFKDYLLGRSFTLVTDHQPLVSILSEKKPIPPMAAARLQRWALLLSAHNYSIQYKKGSSNTNADALSRLPVRTEMFEPPQPQEYVFLMRELDAGTITARQLAKATHDDVDIQTLLSYIRNGWPANQTISWEYSSLNKRRMELSILRDFALLGNRVIVPKSLREALLCELHSTHQGIVKMKATARHSVWWPGIDKQIEDIASRCSSCQASATLPPQAYKSWPKTESPWQRVHADYAGPIEGRYLLILVDSYSKWMEVAITRNTSSDATIRVIRQNIARYGIMQTLVTDNATCFTSAEFQEFVNKNGITHLTSPPNHPPSNGLAERGVRTIKSYLNKVSGGTTDEIDVLNKGLEHHRFGSLELRLDRILMNYRRTTSSTGKTPAEGMFGRNIISRMDIFHPRNWPNSSTSKDSSGTNTAHHSFQIGDTVLARFYGRGSKWIKGTISDFVGNMLFKVYTAKGTIRRHKNQIRRLKRRSDSLTTVWTYNTIPDNTSQDSTPDNANQRIPKDEIKTPEDISTPQIIKSPATAGMTTPGARPIPDNAPRRSTRTRRSPQRLVL